MPDRPGKVKRTQTIHVPVVCLYAKADDYARVRTGETLCSPGLGSAKPILVAMTTFSQIGCNASPTTSSLENSP